MSLFDILEGRMQQIFEGGNTMAPLPFKKLAKQAVREMKRSAVKVDGRSIAPSLYTVLVSPADDAVIAPLYQQVTDELVDFVAHEVQNGGFDLMSAPMVRFIADPNIKQGKMEVVAEVVTPDVLEALRAEEAAYAQNHAGLPARGSMRPQAARPMGAPAGLNRPGQQQRAGRPAPQRQPEMPIAVPPALAGRAPQAAPAPTAAPQQAPERAPRSAAPARAKSSGSCELTDTGSGRTWRIGVASTILGRDEAAADLVLDDTNVSRRHAELTRDASGWHIADLNSTNGTRVNGLRVPQADLHDGDTISMGLVTLSFREI